MQYVGESDCNYFRVAFVKYVKFNCTAVFTEIYNSQTASQADKKQVCLSYSLNPDLLITQTQAWRMPHETVCPAASGCSSCLGSMPATWLPSELQVWAKNRYFLLFRFFSFTAYVTVCVLWKETGKCVCVCVCFEPWRIWTGYSCCVVSECECVRTLLYFCFFNLIFFLLPGRFHTNNLFYNMISCLP